MRKLLPTIFATLTFVVGLGTIALLSTEAAQALGGEMQPGKYLLCTMQQLDEHNGLCPYQDGLPLAGLHGHAGSGGGIEWETYNEFHPSTPEAIFGAYWAGWGTGNPLGGTFKLMHVEGILGQPTRANSYTPTGLPPNTEVTIFVFPEIQEAAWLWGEPCQTFPAILMFSPCGHYYGVRDPEGASLTGTTPAGPTRALALSTTTRKATVGHVLSVEPLVVRR